MSNDTVENSGEFTRPITVRLNEDGTQSAESVLTPTQMTTRAECMLTSRLVIPVIFLPGIMGTRLRSAKNKDQSAWAPPENTWEMLLAALSYLLRSAADRQTMLDPDSTEVDDNGPARVPRETAVLMGDALGNSDAERAKQRGWSQLHADSYGEILNVLEQRLSYMLSDGEHVHQSWQSAVMDWQKDIATPSGMQSGAQRLGAQKDFKALDIEALKTAASAFYPVYAVGYNWLQSNQKSGERLASEIERITKYYRDRKKICEKVIIVTTAWRVRGALSRAGSRRSGKGVGCAARSDAGHRRSGGIQAHACGLRRRRSSGPGTQCSRNHSGNGQLSGRAGTAAQRTVQNPRPRRSAAPLAPRKQRPHHPRRPSIRRAIHPAR